MRQDVADRFTEPYHGYTRGIKYPRTCKKYKKKNAEGEHVESPKDAYTLAGYWMDDGLTGDYKFVRRLLVGNVGRPWDEVYSELCVQADARNYVGAQLREAIDRLVEKHCYIDEDGVVRDDHDFKVDGRWRCALYVHPETKTLEKLEGRRRHVRSKQGTTVFEYDGKLFHCHEGIWYRVEMAPVPEVKYYWATTYSYGLVVDAFKANVDPGPAKGSYYHSFDARGALHRKYGPGANNVPWYCKAKEQANKTEIKAVKKQYSL